MKESKHLVSTLKLELRRQGKTYADLTSVLSLSHASVKRLFSEQSFTLARLDQICSYLNIDLVELVRIMEKNMEKVEQLTVDQELELVKDSKLLCMAHALLNRWSFEEIVETYSISEHEGIHLMARLDKMRVIEMLPNNRYKLLVAKRFSWIPGGPIQRYFQNQLQADYFNSSFLKEDEVRVFVSSMLSRGSIDQIIQKIKKLGDDVNDLHMDDEKLSLDKKKGVSVVLALRPWEIKAFADLRRISPAT
jgi:DNA-binding Xre family transcriptional regulator